MRILMVRLRFNISSISEIWILSYYLGFVYPSGKPMTPHLLCYQGLAVDDYDFAPDAADLGHHRQGRASLDFRSIRVVLAVL
jgi:hypothetical protein